MSVYYTEHNNKFGFSGSKQHIKQGPCNYKGMITYYLIVLLLSYIIKLLYTIVLMFIHCFVYVNIYYTIPVYYAANKMNASNVYIKEEPSQNSKQNRQRKLLIYLLLTIV